MPALGPWARVRLIAAIGLSGCALAYDEEVELVTDVNQDDPCSYYAATMLRVEGPPQ